MTNDFTVVKTAAQAVLEYNIFEDEKWKSVPYARKLTSICVVGSTNIGDFGVEIWAGEARKGTFYNTQAGANVAPSREDERFPSVLIPANAEIQCKVIDAAAANPVMVMVKFDSAKTRRAYTGVRSRGVIRNPTAYAAAVARNRGARRY